MLSKRFNAWCYSEEHGELELYRLPADDPGNVFDNAALERLMSDAEPVDAGTDSDCFFFDVPATPAEAAWFEHQINKYDQVVLGGVLYIRFRGDE